MTTTPSRRSRFPTTQWAEIGRLQAMPVEQRRAALGEFLELYQPALRAYVRRFFVGVGEQDVEEMVQDFAIDRILDYDLIAKVSAERGRLRALLKVACKNYCMTQLRKAGSRPKAAGHGVDVIVSTADESFELSWAEVVMTEAASRVEHRFKSRDQHDRLCLLRIHILDPARGNASTITIAQLAREFGVTPTLMRSKLSKVKQIFVKTMREVVAEYAESSRGVDEELAALKRGLSQSG